MQCAVWSKMSEEVRTGQERYTRFGMRRTAAYVMKMAHTVAQLDRSAAKRVEG